MPSTFKPPVAPKFPHVHLKHGDQRPDDYYWLKDRDDPKVLEYLNKENQYAENSLAYLADLQEAIYLEMQSRIVDTETTAPIKDGQFEYFSRVHKGQNYYAHYRRKPRCPKSEELLIDENTLAENQDYFRLYSLDTCPLDKTLAYAVDLTGNNRCKIQFLDIQNRTCLKDEIGNTSGNFVWSNCAQFIYYATLNETNRPSRIFLHRLGDDPKKDQLLLEELDESFYLYISKSTSKQYIFLTLENQISTEVYLLDARKNDGSLRRVFKRMPNIRYYVQNREDELYVLTNEEAVNFRLMKTSASAPDKANWETVVAHSEDVTLTRFQVFRDYIAISERFEGLPGIRIIQRDGSEFKVRKPDNIQELHVSANYEYDTHVCRIHGNSLSTPRSWFDLNAENGEVELIKVKAVGGDYDASQYTTERHQVLSRDGIEVPLYLVCKKNAVSNRPAPLLLYAYGSYGISYPLHFSTSRLSLLDRGVIFAIAHIRGGGELGENWYQNGKLKKKKNTFSDFNACADYLLDHQFTTSEQFAIMGGSAGGLPIGNYLNSHPGGCKAALALVPFVDILTTILDDDLPLSILERDEWGNPNEQVMYDYIKSYSPYDNVREQQYPALFITAGFHDPQVGYWEPAKWAAKIRARKTDSNLLILKTELKSGHRGKSGRYDAMKETALEYAFVLDQITSRE